MRVLILNTNQIQEVKDSYAVNYLIPKGLAVIATDRVEQGLVKQQAERQARNQEKKNRQSDILKQLNGKTYSIKAKATSEGHLYASIGNNQIKKLLKTKETIEILQRDSIKSIGTHTIDIKVGGKKASISLEITAS